MNSYEFKTDPYDFKRGETVRNKKGIHTILRGMSLYEFKKGLYDVKRDPHDFETEELI